MSKQFYKPLRPSAGSLATTSLVEQVVAKLERALDERRWQAGERIPTVRAIADQFGVSCGVAHAAVRHLQSIGRLRARHGSGTFVSASDDAAGSSAVYILVYGQHVAFSPVLTSLVVQLQEHELTPIPVVLGSKDTAVIGQLIRRWRREPPRAVIVKGETNELGRWVQAAGMTGTRFISVCELPEYQTWHNVRPDEEGVYEIAANYLLQKGHRRLGLVTHGPNGTMGVALKRKGVERAIAASGVDAKLMIYDRTTPTDFSIAQPADDPDVDGVGRWLSAANGPTAVIEHVERMALLRMAARRAGLDFGVRPAIVGVGEPSPGQQGEFPCVSENLDEIARCAVNLIVDPDPELNRVARHLIIPPAMKDVGLAAGVPVAAGRPTPRAR